MVIRGSRKLLIKQLDTSLIEENFVGARGRDAHQIGPRIMVFDADRVFGHGIYKALDHVWALTPEVGASTLPRLLAKPHPNSAWQLQRALRSVDGAAGSECSGYRFNQLTHDLGPRRATSSRALPP